MSSITLERVVKRYGTTTAVAGVDLHIDSGALFFLLGPSGCGKTTLLRMIAGFIEPTEGTIRFDQDDVTALPPNRRNTGMVFQSYALWPHMTVAANVGYGLEVRKVPSAERKRKVAAALERVQMGPYADRKPTQLSGGQQQRVALARALVVEPRVLLLDEPLSNLDAKLRLEMRLEIRRICRETGITTVYVTHDQKEALSMADQVAVLEAGLVCQVGPPRELYTRPATTFVADFLGETNFVHGRVGRADAAEVEVEFAGRSLIASSDAATAPATGAEVVCSIRPEALRMSSSSGGGEGPASGGVANRLEGRVTESVYLGEVAQHHVLLDERVTLKVIETNPGPTPEAGSTVTLDVDRRDVVVLPGG